MQPRKWANPFDTPTGEPRQPPPGPDFDPVLHANGAKASGRIGNVAWALFERGDGLVLALQDLTMSRPLHVPVDANSEKEGFMVFAGEMIAAVGRMTP